MEIVDTPTYRPRILLLEDDIRFVDPLHIAMDAAGFETCLITEIDEALAIVLRGWSPAAVVVDLLLPTSEALSVGRLIGARSAVPVLVVVPGAAMQNLPDTASSRMRVVRRPISPERLAGQLRQILEMRRWSNSSEDDRVREPRM